MPRRPFEPQYYRLGPNHELIACEDVLEWGRYFEDCDRIVDWTGNHGATVDQPKSIFEPRAGICVSTVFLGLDHRFFGDGPPLVFETMVFGGEFHHEQERYGSWAAAEAGHKRWVKKVFPARGLQKASSSAQSATEKSGSAGADQTSTPAKRPASGETTSTPTSAPTSSGRSALARLVKTLRTRR